MTEKKLKEILKHWEAYYQKKGLSTSFIAQCINYAEPILKQDLPVIFDFKHLCMLLALDENYLKSVIYGSQAHYRTFEIPKRSGGSRRLSAPYYTLKYVQTWIYDHILSKVKVNYCAHGFRPNKSILTNAKVHVNNQYMLKVDLKDFFPSITINQVIMIFRGLGYAPKVSFYLASICCLDNCLPQGAPTSPALSNIIARHMDNRLLMLCKKKGYKYTRYADDMAFSGNDVQLGFVDYVKKIVSECHFTINEKKTKVYNGEGAKILTGLSLCNNRIRIPRGYRRNLELELYYIMKYGIGEHMRRKKIKKNNYIESLLGKVNYWLMIEPENLTARSAHDYLNLLYRQKIRV